MKDELTVQQAAAELGVNRETVARWIRDGRLAATNVSGGSAKPRWRIAREAVEAVRQDRGVVLNVAAAGRRLRRIEKKMAELQELVREVRELVNERREE